MLLGVPIAFFKRRRMKQIRFDQYGYIIADKPVEVTLDEIEFYFSTNRHRHRLFNNYVDYINRFQAEIFPYFEQWINGSFVTQKSDPNDIDFVTFLDFKVFERRSTALLEKFMSFNLERQGLDAYIAIDYLY